MPGQLQGQQIENVAALGDEGFLIRSDGRSLLLVAHKPLGVQHAVVTFLQELGCRQFFPGEAWEVIPRRRTIAGSWDRRVLPDFPVQRRIWPGFGLYRQNAENWSVWDRHNRMGGPVAIGIHHSWFGLRPEDQRHVGDTVRLRQRGRRRGGEKASRRDDRLLRLQRVFAPAELPPAPERVHPNQDRFSPYAAHARKATRGLWREDVLAAIEAETVFGGRLNDTNMIHTRPLIGKAFPRRFREFEPLLARLPEENREGKQWRLLGTPPSHEELDSLWEEDRKWLQIE